MILEKEQELKRQKASGHLDNKWQAFFRDLKGDKLAIRVDTIERAFQTFGNQTASLDWCTELAPGFTLLYA